MCKSAADASANSSDEDEVTVFECVLLFLNNIMQEFHCAILKLENESATLLDILEVMSRLRSQLNLRRADRFYGHKTKQATRKLSATEQSKFATLIDCFFEKAILYLEANFDFDDPVLSQTSCLRLSGPMEWDALEGLVNKLALDMEDVWSDKRNRMSVGLVKAELQVRLNFKLSCLEFKAFIEGQHGLLKAAKGDAKYTRKNR